MGPAGSPTARRADTMARGLAENSYDMVKQEELEDGQLSHRWHEGRDGCAKRWKFRVMGATVGAALLGCAVLYAVHPSAGFKSVALALQRLNISPPRCLKDEEEFAGLCYMKCSLLTGGRAPYRLSNTFCCHSDNQFFCTLLQNQQAISPSLAVGGGAAIHNNPHAPGVGGICVLDKEPYQGLCYAKCSDLTNGKSPHRTGPFTCCSGSDVECLSGKGVVSSSTEYGSSHIPEAKDTGRSYKAINIMDARCDHNEDDFGGLCYAKCGDLTYGKSTIRTATSSCCSCGKGFFSGLCCMLPWNVATDPSFMVGASSNGETTDPHPPGMRVRCSSKEEEFGGLCYAKCSDLTNGKLPHRVSSVGCCEFSGESACQTTNAKSVVDVNIDKSQDLSNALPHAPYMRPETD